MPKESCIVTEERVSPCKDAFRNIPVALHVQWRLGFSWDKKLYQETCLSFGLATSPFIFKPICRGSSLDAFMEQPDPEQVGHSSKWFRISSYPWSAYLDSIFKPQKGCQIWFITQSPERVFLVTSYAGISGPPPGYLSQLLPKEYFPGLITRGTRSAAPQLPGGFMSLFLPRNPTLLFNPQHHAQPLPRRAGNWEGPSRSHLALSLREKWGQGRGGGVGPSALEG